MFVHPQEKSSDSLGNNNVDSGEASRAPQPKQNIVSAAQENANKKLVETLVDAGNSKELQATPIIVVPYQSKINQDSLRAELRKVVLEIDTLPKGLNLIYRPSKSDSLMIKPASYSKSLFTSHLLLPKELQPHTIEKHHHNWISLLLLAMLLMLGILRVFYQKKLNLFLSSAISKRFSNQVFREENALTQGTSVVLTFIFFTAISLFFYLSSDFLPMNFGDMPEFQKYLLILASCLGFYFLKLLLHKVCGLIFKAYKETDEYIFNQFIVIQVSGLLLVIWCILMSYCKDIDRQYLVFAGFSTLLLGYFVRMIKSLGISNIGSYSAIYIFLYLCSLEILPLIIIIKLILG